MDAATLCVAMGNRMSLAYYAHVVPAVNAALIAADCTTVARSSMWAGQICAESGGLEWWQELASGTDYDRYINPSGPWQELGNIEAGDGARFKGRGPLEVTGRGNYTRLSLWMFRRKKVPTPTYFVDHPEQLATLKYGLAGATWFWLGKHPRFTTRFAYLNDAADAHDVVGATWIINGGQSNLYGRQQGFDRGMSLGNRMLPTPTTPKEIDAMPRLVQNTTGGKRYILEEGQIPEFVEKTGAAAYARGWGLPLTPHPVSSADLKAIERIALRKNSGVLK